jgi:hypothetical protein
VASAAIAVDGIAVLGGVAAVVAAETAREIGVADIYRILAPGDVHFGEDVAVVDGEHFLW